MFAMILCTFVGIALGAACVLCLFAVMGGDFVAMAHQHPDDEHPVTDDVEFL